MHLMSRAESRADKIRAVVDGGQAGYIIFCAVQCLWFVFLTSTVRAEGPPTTPAHAKRASQYAVLCTLRHGYREVEQHIRV